jgi:hypothetical protein
MDVIKNVKLMWHKFWSKYNRILHESCLDKGMKNKFWNSVQYHDKKLLEVT